MCLELDMGAAAAAGRPLEGPVKARIMGHVIRGKKCAEQAETGRIAEMNWDVPIRNRILPQHKFAIIDG
jgi:hypothetical protein